MVYDVKYDLVHKVRLVEGANQTLVKLQISDKRYSSRMIAELESKENVRFLFESKNVQNVSKCVWSCAKLRIQSQSLTLFGLLDSRADWLFENGKYQEVANSVWACATLGYQSPNLFRLLDSRADWLFENGNHMMDPL
jgi:hypothetical protein